MTESAIQDSDNLVIFDTDLGADDAWAFLMLTKAEQVFKKIKLLAVTCVHGNTEIDHVVRNVFRLMDTMERPDIPVYKGAASGFLPFSRNDNFHGKDGLGDVYPQEDDAKIFSRLKKEHAVTAMYELVSKYPKRVTFLMVGPLTNLALCVKMYPDFCEKVKDLFIMGGNRRGIGNITTCAEFNFYADPEAAFIVMNEDKLVKTVLPWETCYPKIEKTTLEWRLNVLGAIKTPVANLMNPVDERVYSKSFSKSWSPCDAYLVASFLFPELIVKKISSHHVSVELAGTHTRGQMVVDYVKARSDNARIISLIDVENFRKIALWTAGHEIEL